MKIIEDGDLKILAMPGDVHGDVVDSLSLILEEILETDCRLLAIDMFNVSYIYSRGIGVLVRTQKAFKEKEGKLYLFNLRPSLQKIFPF